MTWDIYALRVPRSAPRLEELSVDAAPLPIGSPEEVLAIVREAVPEAEESGPGWLVVDVPGARLEIGIGKAEVVRDVTFHITAGDRAVPVVLAVCRALRVTPYDTESGELLGPDSSRPEPPPSDEDEEPEGDRRRRRRWWRRKAD